MAARESARVRHAAQPALLPLRADNRLPDMKTTWHHFKPRPPSSIPNAAAHNKAPPTTASCTPRYRYQSVMFARTLTTKMKLRTTW